MVMKRLTVRTVTVDGTVRTVTNDGTMKRMTVRTVTVDSTMKQARSDSIRPTQNGCHFADIFKLIFFNKKMLYFNIQ